ncbi:MAG: SDR family NAD(P)-dependent oxidoreductase [Vicinamibacterales bacterium]
MAITGRDAAQLDEAGRRMGAAAASSLKILQADVRAHDQVGEAVRSTVESFGGLDVLVNNAGVGVFRPVSDMTPHQWADVIDTNLTGVYNCCHVAIPHLRSRGGGYIVNISSLAGKNSFVGAAAYCASKAGLNAFSEALMMELRQENIRVTYIMPGSVATGFSGGDEHAGIGWKIGPSDIAELVLDLLRMSPRTLPSRIEVRPSKPPSK